MHPTLKMQNGKDVRVVTHLEKINRGYDGLNLTDYTAWGILHHSKIKYGECKINIDGVCSLRHSGTKCTNRENMLSLDFYDQYNRYLNENSWTLEGLVVRMADEIAQRHHDIEDGLEAKIIDKDEIIGQLKDLFRKFLSDKDKEKLENISKEEDKSYYLSGISGFIVNFLTTRLIEDTSDRLKDIKDKYHIRASLDFSAAKSEIKSKLCKGGTSLYSLVSYNGDFSEREEKLQEYLGNRVLNSYLAQRMDGKANYILRNLIKAYLTNPQQLPDKTILGLYRHIMEANEWDRKYHNKPATEIVGDLRNILRSDHFEINDIKYRHSLLRTICDFIAGMTDQFALEQYELLYGEKMIGKL